MPTGKDEFPSDYGDEEYAEKEHDGHIDTERSAINSQGLDYCCNSKNGEDVKDIAAKHITHADIRFLTDGSNH